MISRKELQPLATAIGRACVVAGVTEVHLLPEPARALAFEVRRVCAVSAPNFSPSTFDGWICDVATGKRHPITGDRVRVSA